MSNFTTLSSVFLFGEGGSIVILFIGQVHSWQALFGLTLICLRTDLQNTKLGNWREHDISVSLGSLLSTSMSQPFYWFPWCLYMCFASPFLELKAWLQRPQGIEIPAIWFASTWCIMFARLPSFPHTLHFLALPPSLLLGLAFSLNVIIGFNCWFKHTISVLLVVWSVRTSAFSFVVDCIK